MTVGATQTNCFGRVHGRFIRLAMAGDATGGFCSGFRFGLTTQWRYLVSGLLGSGGEIAGCAEK
ncbi:MAG: hypothetical protein NVS9B14_07330 [Candidatus Acidiferrum sp.]